MLKELFGKTSRNPDRDPMTREVIRMAWPSICESFFITLANFIDTLMVSSLGSAAVAAVGLTTQPKFIGLAAFFAMNIAISAIVARRFGEQRREDANRVIPSALAAAVVIAVLISVVSITCADRIMDLCGAMEETHGMAVEYFRIIMGGIILNAVSICINAAQRGAGNTKLAMQTNLTANLVNICGNYVLIGGHLGFPALGIRGAAIATVFGFFIGFLMSIRSLLKKGNYLSVFYILENRIGPSLQTLKEMVRVGYAVLLEQVLMRAGFMATAVMAASLGTAVMAAHQVGMNTLGLSFSFGDGMQVAAVALIGRSLGEGNKEKAKKYGLTCRGVGIVLIIVIDAFFLLFGRTLYTWFFEEPEIIEYGVRIMRVFVFVVFFQVSQVIYMGALRGAGDTGYTAFASTVSVTVVRTLFSWLLGIVLGLGITGIWLGILADQISRYLFAMFRFRKGEWVNIRI